MGLDRHPDQSGPQIGECPPEADPPWAGLSHFSAHSAAGSPWGSRVLPLSILVLASLVFLLVELGKYCFPSDG